MSIFDSSRSLDLRLGEKRYMPGLDGLRAISVLAVIAYHLNFSWAQGGFLGVAIFFTLSGYLITDQLMLQWERTGKIDLRDFWIRRVRRLMPAVFFMLAVVAVWLAFFDRSRLAALKNDFASVALYFNNWWLIFHNVSYFESFGPPSPIGHLWSLAIEEQFYLLWPLLLIFGLRFAPQRRKLALFTLAGAVASMLAMFFIYRPGADPSRVYYGTDTRAFALLIGAAFAIIFPSWKLSKQASLKKRLLLDFTVAAGLLWVLYTVWRTNEYDSSMYTGGLAAFSVLSAVIVTLLAHPASMVAKLLGSKPLRWIGIRSYSLYLWHFPVIILTTPSVDTGGFNLARTLFQVVMSFVMAVISYNYIEKPIRNGLLSRKKIRLPQFNMQFSRKYALVFVMVPLFLFVNSCSSPLNKSNRTLAAAASLSVKEPAVSTSATAISPSPSPSEVPSPSVTEHPAVAPSPTVQTTGQQPKKGEGITVIGDSVMVGAAPYLNKMLPGIVVDGKVGRQMYQAREILDSLKAGGKLGNCIVIELGTNGSFDPSQLSKLISSLGDVKQVVLVNVRVPRKWQDKVNADLKTVAGQFKNVTLVDWFSASKGKDSLFYSDGVHLKAEGYRYYASLISNAIKTE